MPIKYRDKAGNTWAGRGAQPRWLTAAIKAGAKRDDFLVDKSAAKKSRKKTRRKTRKKTRRRSDLSARQGFGRITRLSSTRKPQRRSGERFPTPRETSAATLMPCFHSPDW